jgi:hypothetical protein
VALLLWLIVFWREVRLAPLLVGGALGLVTAMPLLVNQVQAGWPVLAAFQTMPEAVVDLSAIRLGWEAITGRGIHALAGNAYVLLSIVPHLDWIFNAIGWMTVAAALWLAWRMVMAWRAVYSERRQGARVDLILLSWLVVPLVFNLRHSLDLHLHFFALVIPAAYLIVGRAVQALFRELHNRTSDRSWSGAWSGDTPALRFGILGGLVFLAAAQVVALGLMARFVATHDTPGGFGTPLRSHLAIADQAMAMADHTGAAEVLVVGRGDSPVVDETPAIFDVLLRDRVAYRFVDGDSAAVFPPHRALALIVPDAGAAAAWYQPRPASDLQPREDGYRLVSLDGSWPQDGLEPLRGPRIFQNGVEIQGHGWQGDAIPGGKGRFWLLWQVLWESPDDTHFFVHLVDDEGQLWGQQDAVGYPTAHRDKGDRIISAFDISIRQEAPSGPYLTRAGLYLYPEIVNVPVIDDAGNPVGDTVSLGPVGKAQ